MPHTFSCLMFACATAFADAGGPFEGPGDIEIQFAPMDMDMQGGQDLMDFLAAAGPPGRGPGAMRGRGPARGGREADLDNMLFSALNGMLGPGGRGGPGGMPGGMTQEIIIEGPSGTQVVTMGGPMAGKGGKPQSLRGGLLRDLFPGAMLAPGGPVLLEGPPDGFGRSPMGIDPMMMDIMQDLDRSFAENMMPAIQKASTSERDPRSCVEDVKKNCAGAKSHLHCLGINHDTISEACRKEVGNSVPFLCSRSIDRYCDVLQTGILDCLYGHMQELEAQCRDAVLTTKHVINKVNTQTASMVDPSTGAQKVSVPTKDTPLNQEAKLDVKLGLAQTATAPKPPAAAPSAAAGQEKNLDVKLGLATSPAAALRATAAAAQVPPSVPQVPSGGIVLHRFQGPFIFALLAFVFYIFAYSGELSKIRRDPLRMSREGAKLLNTGTELPKPDAMY